MANFVLIAGTFHGGWYWDPIAPILNAAGHRVFAPTLSGLDRDSREEVINLDTHIDDVLRVIDEHRLDEVILVGWSYGGMVITGVADRTASIVQKMIYLDGQVPQTGQREWDLMPEADRLAMLDTCQDGLNIYPDDGMLNHEPRMQPHPLATKLQPLDYDPDRFERMQKVYVFAEKWFHDPEVPSPLRQHFDRVQTEPNWTTHSWPYGHDLVREAAQGVGNLLLAEA